MAQRGFEYRLVGAIAALVAIGLAMLYSAGQTDVPTSLGTIWQRQLIWLGLGVGLATLVYRVSPRLLEWSAPFVYGASLVVLGLTLVLGTGAGTAAGTKSWLAVGGVRVGQPAEIAKLATILMLARHLGARRTPLRTVAELVPPCLIVGVPFVLVGLQPDLGSAIVFLGILFGVLFWAGVAPRLLLMLASPVISLLLAFSTLSWGAWIVVLTILLLVWRPYVLEAATIWLANVIMGVIALDLWRRLAPYQQNRLLSFLNPEIDPQATGWNIIQSKVAIGSGGLFGKGFTLGTQKRLAFLPAQHTDFVFPILAEEWGFAGVVVVLTLFTATLWMLVRIARDATDPYSSVMVAGIAALLFTHVVENVGMAVGLMPITGIPLPFFSYGGSFLLTCCLAVALVLRVAWDSRNAGYVER
jgi:rod shape determining protein RodA